MEQLIVSTIKEESRNVEKKLEGLLVFYKKICEKYELFRPEDRKIVYKKLVEELGRLGYLEEEDDDNFCSFLADYFRCIPNLTAKVVREQIEA